jgi:hypothetical protein
MHTFQHNEHMAKACALIPSTCAVLNYSFHGNVNSDMCLFLGLTDCLAGQPKNQEGGVELKLRRHVRPS